MSEYLAHYGTPRHSGRYPYGSGENPYQHTGDFLSMVNDMRKSGAYKDDTEISRALGMTSGEFRSRVTLENLRAKKEGMAQARKLADTGMSNTAIAKELGKTEGTIRNWLKEGYDSRIKKHDAISDALTERVEKYKYIDVGEGVDAQLGCSRTKLNAVIADLEGKGYITQEIHYEQVANPGKWTTMRILTKADVPKSEILANKDQVKSMNDIWLDGDEIVGFQPPRSVSSKRLAIRYGDDEVSGKDRDGLIEIRPGVEDITLGDRHYAQVRIAVDNQLYLKGMAVYNNDLPPGVDIRFNTNKDRGTPLEKVLKPLKFDPDTGVLDPDLPFGAKTRQLPYTDKNGKQQISAVNIVNDNTDWDDWSKTLASQFLSKQPTETAKMQLDKTYAQKEREYEEISKLVNPEVRKKLLESFADDCEASSVHLKACGFDGQKTHVLLPVPSLKDGEIYAPGYDQGEEVILIRYPHAGTFEIPCLKVNNNNKEAIAMMGKGDEIRFSAVGINPRAAQQLSGADFDGDTAVVIPVRGLNLKADKANKELMKFDPGDYKNPPDVPETGPQTGFHKGMEMGKVSNLITDMTIKGAPIDDIVKAVKYSMVVIDAQKHNYDWRQAKKDNDIDLLTKRYQMKPDGRYGGASTLISRASSPIQIGERKAGKVIVDPETGKKRKMYVDPETGKKLYEYTNRTYLEPLFYKDENGKKVYVKDEEGNQVYKNKEKQAVTSIKKMQYYDDAYELSSGTLIENIYANYANKLKAISNKARKEALSTPTYKLDRNAEKIYKDEVKSINSKLANAEMNLPRERQANLIATKTIEMKKKQNPNLDSDQLSKIKSKALERARKRVGSWDRDDKRIKFTDKEWEAIQAHAVSGSKMKLIVRFADQDELRKKSMPRANTSALSSSQAAQARALLKSGKYTQSQVADRFGISVSSLRNVLDPEKKNEL